jgi:gliding motility-associated-like protein
MNKVLSFLSLAFLLLYYSYSIAQGATCGAANQICGTTPPFPANTTGGTAVGSIAGSVGCLGSTPNESWFFFEVAVAGPVSGSITNSNNVDVDGAIFGPFTTTTAACAGLTAGNIVACDFSASANVPFSFNAVPGIYMVLITNFSGQATTINLGFSAASNALIDCIAESADYSICEGDPAQAMTATVLSSNALCPPATTTVTCTTNTPATTGSYTLSVSTSVNASCNISGIPAGATVTNVSYSINGGAVNGSWCQELRVNVDGPGTTYDITGGSLVGATGACTLAGLSAVGGWSGSSTNSPNGTYTFSFYETSNQAGTSQDFSVTQIQVAVTYVSGPSPALTWFNTQTGGTAIGTGSPFQPIGAAGSDVPNTSTAGVYDFWVGCGNDGIRSQVQVFIHDVPTITSTSVVCAGSTFTATINAPAISASPTGCSWQYSFNNGATWGTSNTLTGIAPGSANLTVLVRNSCRNQCISAAATIVIPSAIIPTFNPVGPYCAGSTIPALPTSSTNSPAITGTWSPAINNTTTTTYTFTPATNQCATTTTLTITINPRPTVTVNSSTVCEGTATTVTATPGSAGTYSYSWTVPGGVTNPGNVASFSTTVAGTYSVVITNTTTGCTSLSASGTVTVNPLPAVNAGPDQAICIGSSVTLAATGASTYSWNNGVTQGVAFSPSATNTYTVTGTSAAGCINTDQVVVTVNPLPIVNAPDATVCVGGSVTLTASGATTYTWAPASYLNTTTGASVVSTPPSNITYTVTGTDANGCIASDAVTVTVSGNAPINAGPDVAICVGQSTTITATGGVTYNWNNGLGAGASHTISPTATTTYTVTGTDANGCLGTDAVVVTVNPLPIVNAGADQTVCEGTSVTLTATGASTYSWDNGVTNGVAFTPSVGTTTYTVTGTSAAGCVATDQVVVTVNPLPLVNAGPDFAVCSGNTATLTGTGAVVYTWNNGVTNGISFTPSATNTYTVTGTDANGCINTDQVTVSVLTNAPVNAGPDVAICNGQSTTLTASGAVTFNWDQGLGTGNNFVVAPTGTTTYTVVGTDGNGCIGTDAITVTVNPLPSTNAGPDQTVCQGTSVTLTATGATTYSWDNGVTNGVAFTPGVGTVTYTVSGTSAAGCITTDQVVVTVNPLPTTDAGPDQTVCAGTAVTLTASGAASYSWTGGVNQGVAFTPAATSTYTVTGTSAAGCTTTDQVTVTVNPLPTTNAGPDQTVCEGTAVTLTATGAATYSWDNGVVNGIAFTPAVGTITYTVTGTSAEGCITTDQVLVTVNPNPSPVIQGPTEYCAGFSATLSTTVPYTTYNWSTGATSATINATVANNPISVTVTNGFGCQATSATYTVTENAVITANFTETICQGGSVLIHGVLQSVAGTYSQTFTTASGCDSTSNVTLVVNPLPAVNAGIDQAVCTGTSTVLNATGAINYSWNNGVTQGVPFTQAIGSTVYTVTGTDINGCINTDQVTITVNPLPVVDAGVDQAVCIGGSVTLNGSGASTYTWNNGVTNGAAFAPSVTTTYTVTGTNTNGCVNTDQMTVTVNPLPNVNAGPDQAVCIGGAVTLSGSGAVNYSWNNGVTNGVAFIPSATTTYTVTGTDANGCINSDQVVVTVNPLPVVDAGPDQTVCIGASVTLTATGAATYSWNNGVTNGVAFTPAATNTYTVTGTSAAGCISTDQVTVNVNPLPNVNAGPDQAICIGASITLTGSGASTYIWNNGVTNGVSFSPTLTNTYTVVGTDINGCVNTDQVIVTVNALPNVNAGNDINVCEGASVTLSGLGAQTYTWNNGVTNGVTFVQPVGTQTYTVVGTDANGCVNSDQVVVTVNALPNVNAGPDQTLCLGGAVTLSGSGASIYSWNNGVTNGVPFTPSAGSMTYTVTGTNANGCINTDQVVVTVNPLPNVNAGTDQVVCEGESVTLTAIGAITYSWNNGVVNGLAFTPPVGSTTYTVSGTDNNGCVNTDQVIVIVNPLPSVNAGNDVSVCDGQTVVLTASGATTYTWNNSVVNGSPFVPSLGTTTYTVVGTSAAGCINSDQVNVTVNPNPQVSFVPGAANGCTPFTTTLTNTTADVSNCVWTISNGTVITGCGTVPVTFTQGGCYDVTLTTTSANGCSSTFTANNLICVEDNPDAAFSPSSNQLSTLNTEVFFQNNTTGANQYAWTFGVSDFVSTETNPTYTYPNNGEGQYVVTLVATSPLGCTDTATTIIQVYEELLFYVPNTFTPDNDKYNPVFLPIFTSGFDPFDYNLMIFNRWGEVIFESNNHEVGWDGSYGKNGEIEMVQDGVYTWKIEFKVTRWDERRRVVGHVNLIR